MEQSVQILRQRIQHRAARRQLRAPLIGAALTIGLAVAFWSTVHVLLF